MTRSRAKVNVALIAKMWYTKKTIDKLKEKSAKLLKLFGNKKMQEKQIVITKSEYKKPDGEQENNGLAT